MKVPTMRLKISIRVPAIAACVAIVAGAANAGAGQAPGGRGPQPVDPRVQIRMHHFAETNQEIPYSLFVSSKVKKNKKAPLVVTLHGIGGTHLTMMRPNAIDLAEAGGYILLAPMGYNPRGWYGAPLDIPGNRPRSSGQPPPPVTQSVEEMKRERRLSETDVMNVLALVTDEYNVDPDRTYLMGHSMGGAGTLHLAIKYPRRWAAIAALAPAAFAVDRDGLSKIPKMPVMLVHGDMDTVVPVTVGRAWAEAMKSIPMKDYRYIEVPGGDHGTVIGSHQAEVFAFFARHSR